MSWRNRVAAASGLVLAGGALAGCGFHPVYAERTGLQDIEPILASVRVSQMHDHLGQAMTNTLRDGFNPHAMTIPPAYQLDVGLTKIAADQAVRRDGTASHTLVQVNASFQLRRLTDNQVVLSSSAQSLNGFDVLDNQYANEVSVNTQEMRAVKDLSDQIQQRVALYLQQARSKT